MTPVPPPASPCLRVHLDYFNSDNSRAGSRFNLGYAGAAPTAANCVTLATDVAAAWNTNLAPLISSEWSLREVDVQDIATETGASGVWTGNDAGSSAGAVLPSQVATNIEFNIARRYRGGKPRMFLPCPGASAQSTPADWTSDFTAAVDTGITAFFAELEALSIGAVGQLTHVNLSYYQGFKNITNSSGRERAVPTYRAAALLDTVTGYSTKQTMGSQRRRRTSTSY